VASDSLKSEVANNVLVIEFRVLIVTASAV
jgi:hypothetical protein